MVHLGDPDSNDEQRSRKRLICLVPDDECFPKERTQCLYRTLKGTRDSGTVTVHWPKLPVHHASATGSNYQPHERK